MDILIGLNCNTFDFSFSLVILVLFPSFLIGFDQMYTNHTYFLHYLLRSMNLEIFSFILRVLPHFFEYFFRSFFFFYYIYCVSIKLFSFSSFERIIIISCFSFLFTMEFDLNINVIQYIFIYLYRLALFFL